MSPFKDGSRIGLGRILSNGGKMMGNGHKIRNTFRVVVGAAALGAVLYAGSCLPVKPPWYDGKKTRGQTEPYSESTRSGTEIAQHDLTVSSVYADSSYTNPQNGDVKYSVFIEGRNRAGEDVTEQWTFKNWDKALKFRGYFEPGVTLHYSDASVSNMKYPPLRWVPVNTPLTVEGLGGTTLKTLDNLKVTENGAIVPVSFEYDRSGVQHERTLLVDLKPGQLKQLKRNLRQYNTFWLLPDDATESEEATVTRSRIWGRSQVTQPKKRRIMALPGGAISVDYNMLRFGDLTESVYRTETYPSGVDTVSYAGSKKIKSSTVRVHSQVSGKKKTGVHNVPSRDVVKAQTLSDEMRDGFGNVNSKLNEIGGRLEKVEDWQKRRGDPGKRIYGR